jgi:hypothetical protein
LRRPARLDMARALTLRRIHTMIVWTLPFFD